MAKGVVWLGANGNLYTKQVGQQGVRDAGSAQGTGFLIRNPSMKQWNGLDIIADPNPPQQKVQSTPAPVYPNGGGGGSTAPAVDKSNDIRLNQAGISAADRQARTGIAAVDKALAGLFGQYGSEAKANEQNYTEQSDTNQNNRQRGIQTSLVNAAQGRRGLFGVLSSLGALSGSGIDLANEAVQKGANADLSGVSDTFSTNQTGLNTAIESFRREDESRRKQATTSAEDARTGVRNQSAKAKQQLYTNLANDYAAMGDMAKAAEYTRLASDIYTTIADTSVPSSNLAYTSAAFTPGTLGNYLIDSESTQVSTTPSDGNGIPGLIALPANRKRQTA